MNHHLSRWEPWQEVGEDDTAMTDQEAQTTTTTVAAAAACKPPNILDDNFTRLFIYNTKNEREDAFEQVSVLIYEILREFCDEKLPREISDSFGRILQLQDTDYLHILFFGILCSSCSNPDLFYRIAAMTQDVTRFVKFIDWLGPQVTLLTQNNGRMWVHRVRCTWLEL